MTPAQFLAKRYKEGQKAKPKPGPLWKGPLDDGITYSMLCRFLVCKERFRIAYMEGLQTQQTFDHKLEYGHMFHRCDELHADGLDWKLGLDDYARKLMAEHKLARKDIERYRRACLVQFTEYVRHWKATDKANVQKSIDQEWKFDVKYELPNHRFIRLRGKTDGVFQQGVKKLKLWTVKETKTKGEIDTVKVLRQLTFDLQTMIYLTALSAEKGLKDEPIKVYYNLVKRPLGHGSIKQLKPSRKMSQGESTDEFFARLGATMRADPGKQFQRVEATIKPEDLQKFKDTCLDPLLMNVAHWYDVMSGHCDPTEACYGIPPPNWRHPFGVYNILDEGGSSDLDEYLATGVPVGLVRREKLFTELE